MSDTLRDMLRLQELDLELNELNQRAKAAAPKIDALAKDALRRADGLKKTEAALADTTARRRRAETDLKAAEDKLAHAVHAQEQVRTAKEGVAATHEFDAAKAKVDALENEILTLLDGEETGAAALATARAAAAKTGAAADVERGRLTAMLVENKGLAKDLREERIAAANRIDEEALPDYEWALKEYGTPAIVGVRDGACGGCGTALPPHTLNDIREPGAPPVPCDRCRRLLARLDG